MNFPVYRKYINNKSYFKVLDFKEFEEIQVLGKNYWVHTFKAKILPDHHLIKDLVEMKGERWIEITETEYLEFLEMCEKEFNKRN